MPRLPFDPDRALGPQAIAPSEDAAQTDAAGKGKKRFATLQEAQRLTVSQVSELIKTTLEQRLPSPIRVIGQVSNLGVKNHWYFSLKDEGAVLSCVAWATAARKFGFTPKDGDEVVALGHISHFGPQGRTQLYVSELSPVGAGALELQFRALCEELRCLGYFEEARKKPLPIFPRRIAVITSATGAAMHDVINTAAQRCKAVGLVVVDVRVQGEGAAQEVARAIKWVDGQRARLGVDAILVTRGGGSIEDLWAFNERIVADAVFKCTLPVVAAIGHESDTTVIELVADLRASTPTQAAMRLIPSAPELCKQIGHLEHRLAFMLNRTLERQRHRAARFSSDLQRVTESKIARERTHQERLAGRLAALQPHALMAQCRTRLLVSQERLNRAVGRRLEDRARLERMKRSIHLGWHRHLRRLREGLVGATRRLEAVDPLGVLRRGYSLTTLPDGTVIRSVRQTRSGESIITRLADGSITSAVASIRSGVSDVAPPPPSSRKRTSAQPMPRRTDQMDLFGGSQ